MVQLLCSINRYYCIKYIGTHVLMVLAFKGKHLYSIRNPLWKCDCFFGFVEELERQLVDLNVQKDTVWGPMGSKCCTSPNIEIYSILIFL